MKTIKLFIAAISFLLQLPAIAQVQIDQQLQFTGTGTSAEITGVQAVSNNQDAANKIYVDTAIANRAGSSLITHYIGEFYGGGMVVAVWDSSGVEQGLIVDTSGNLSASAVWTISEKQTTQIGAAAESPDNGQANTAAMIAQWGAHTDTAGTAASICQHYNNGGFTDWYLPALLELNDCFTAWRTINNIIGDTKGLSFTNNTYYWSSTENNGSYVWYEGFANGFTFANAFKSTGNSVRCVRRY